jgi:hypothetical protein
VVHRSSQDLKIQDFSSWEVEGIGSDALESDVFPALASCAGDCSAI